MYNKNGITVHCHWLPVMSFALEPICVSAIKRVHMKSGESEEGWLTQSIYFWTMCNKKGDYLGVQLYCH